MSLLPDRLPDSLPRASDPTAFHRDPFEFLARHQRQLGDLFVIQETGPIFSRNPDCPGVVAAFGPRNLKTVLGDADVFGMPESAARHLGLTPTLLLLNRGLHSMRGSAHDDHRRRLSGMLEPDIVHDTGRAFEQAIRKWLTSTAKSRPFPLVRQMRQWTRQAASHFLFGAPSPIQRRLVTKLETYFHQRRDITRPGHPIVPEAIEALERLGQSLDLELRQWIRACRREERPRKGGLLARLAVLSGPEGALFSEDELVGHANVLFISALEPTAVTLAWILLVLSQRPDLRDILRHEFLETASSGTTASTSPPVTPAFLDRVILECLRLLPPNAFMVRAATQPTSLDGHRIPAGTEVVVCPFVSHREARVFHEPDTFLPDRWQTAAPSPFEYFPFGAGGHSCIGRALSLHLLRTALTALLSRVDVLLAGDQAIDWRLHILFMPKDDPRMIASGFDPSARPTGGRMLGPVKRLLGFA